MIERMRERERRVGKAPRRRRCGAQWCDYSSGCSQPAWGSLLCLLFRSWAGITERVIGDEKDG